MQENLLFGYIKSASRASWRQIRVGRIFVLISLLFDAVQSDCAQLNFPKWLTASFGNLHELWLASLHEVHQQQAENKLLGGFIRKCCRMFWEMKRKKTEGRERGGTSSSALIYCSHDTSPSSLPPSLSLFVLYLPSQSLHFWQHTNLIYLFKFFSFLPTFYCTYIHFLLSLLLSQMSRLSALDKMEVCQSLFVTPPDIYPSIHPSIASLRSSVSIWEGSESPESSVCVTCLSVSIKLKYSCARSAPCNNRWCRSAKDSQFPWQPPTSILFLPLPSSLDSVGW